MTVLRQLSLAEWTGWMIAYTCDPHLKHNPAKSPVSASSKTVWFYHHLSPYNIAEERCVMPKKQQTWQQVVFFNAPMDKSDKKKFEEWTKLPQNEFHERVGNEVVLGWKVSISWDDDNECYIGAMTQRNEGHINYNTCITSRSDVMWEAIALCAYKIDKYNANTVKVSGEAAKNNWG